jgi:hypothetical protein
VTKEKKQMRNAFGILLLTAATVAAQATGSTGSAAPSRAKKATTATRTTGAKPLTIPSDAIANADGTYSWTDKEGKKWTYVKTPFGIVRSEVSQAPAASSSLSDVKAFDEGDTVRFEKQSPFGVVKWQKKKTELTDEERDLLTKQAAGQNAKQD